MDKSGKTGKGSTKKADGAASWQGEVSKKPKKGATSKKKKHAQRGKKFRGKNGGSKNKPQK